MLPDVVFCPNYVAEGATNPLEQGQPQNLVALVAGRGMGRVILANVVLLGDELDLISQSPIHSPTAVILRPPMAFEVLSVKRDLALRTAEQLMLLVDR